MCDLSALRQKGSLTPAPPTLQKHINQVSQKCQRPSTCHCGLLCRDWWSDGRLPQYLTYPHPISYPHINLHTMWKITNDNVLKNDSQYPPAIQINNSLLLKKGVCVGGGDRQRWRAREGDVPVFCFLYWHLWLKGCEKFVREAVCVWKCVCVLRTEDALNIWCMLKAAVASIGSLCIQRPIKMCPRGEGVIGRDSCCQDCLCTYLSEPTQTGLNLNTLEVFPLSLPFPLVYLSFTKSIQLSLLPSAAFVTHLSLVLSLSSLLTRFVCFAQHPHVSSPQHSVLHAVTFRPSLRNAAPPPPLFVPSELSNGSMKWAGEMMREIAILTVWHEALSQAPLINEFQRALALWWTMLIRHGNPNKDVSR